MSAINKLTPAEWEIMEAIWELGGAPSVRDVLEHSFANGKKAYTTVQTVMNILEKKGLLKRKKKGLVNFYKPSKNRDQMINSELSQMVARMFQGSLPVFTNYLSNLKIFRWMKLKKLKFYSMKKKQL